MTSNTERTYPGEAVVTVGSQQSKAMADQIMAADKTRLAVLPKTNMRAVEETIKVHLPLPLSRFAETSVFQNCAGQWDLPRAKENSQPISQERRQIRQPKQIPRHNQRNFPAPCFTLDGAQRRKAMRRKNEPCQHRQRRRQRP